MRGTIPYLKTGRTQILKTISRKMVCFSLPLFFLFLQTSLFGQCPGGSGVIGGTVIGDYNFNGIDDQSGGVRNATVNLYNCTTDGASVLVATTTSDHNGNYFFSGLTDGADYKIEFETPAGLVPGFGGSDFGSGIQFSKSPNCSINTAFSAAEDFFEADPEMITTCFINGDPLASGNSGAGSEVLVGFAHSSTGQAPGPQKYASALDMGSVYGIAYDRFDKYLFTSAFLKRHVGFGTEGLGGIYVMDASGSQPTMAFKFDLTNLGISLGSISSNAARGLQPNTNDASNDPEAFDKVGKIGIGAIEVDYAGDYLYVINLFEKKLHKIDIRNLPTIPTAANVTTFDLPTTGCSGGEYRPFAVKAYRGDIYIGGVCDASVSQQASDLKASIHKLVGSSFQEIVNFPLDYTKGNVTMHADCENYSGWYPWLDGMPVSCDGGPTIVYPQPILSDFEFDTDGSIIAAFTDKLGHQLGFKNYPLTGTTPLLTNVSGGDILRINLENDGTYTLENNAQAGDFSTNGANNGEGPGGGEYYHRDVFEGGLNNIIPPAHSETSQGGIAFYRGSGLIATTALDPYSIAYNTGGINWMDNRTGAIRNDEGFQLYRTSSSNIATFAKANGLGDLFVRPSLAPMQIGGAVWVDANADGIQDGCEAFLGGVEVSLFDDNGNLVATTTTAPNGEYYFNDSDLNLNTDYFIVFGTNGAFDTSTKKLNGDYFYTLENAGNDFNDSDIRLAGATIGGGAFAGLPFTRVTTGSYGFVDHSFDAGFTPVNPNPEGTIGGNTWIDLDGDGIQDPNEGPMADVKIQLIDPDGNIIGTTITNQDGSYSFDNLPPGTYCLVFDTPPGNTLTQQNQGNGSNDSDPDPLSGKTTVIFDPGNTGDKLEIDAGFIPDKEFIGGLVFVDCNQNGLYDGGEAGLSGVKITLVGTGRELFSDSNGNYQFDGLLPDDYVLQFEIPNNFSGLVFSAKDQGMNDDRDSDVNPDNGTTDVLTLVLGGGFDNIFAGVQDIDAPVLQNVPGDLRVDLTAGGIIPAVPTDITATDNYDTDVSVDFDFREVLVACGYEIIRTWTASDDCGNITEVSQVITVDEGCVCPGTKISDADVTPACGQIGGSAVVKTTGDFSEYDFIWIPNRGTVGANANERNGLPVGTYLVILEHQQLDNCNDKIYIQIVEDCDSFQTPDSVSLLMKIGETVEHCQSVETLTGTQFFNKTNCLTGCDLLNITATEGSDCFEAFAKKAGQTTFEFEVCDFAGKCVKTVYNVEVEKKPFGAVPVAEPDNITVQHGKPVVIDVCANDFLQGEVTRVAIVKHPNQGRLQVNEDFTATYLPEANQCGKERFEYEICTDAGCDISEVILDVECLDLNPVSGFSPNGDGINDFFTIDGIDRYENELRIFNRGGNIVFKQKQYQNDWSGDFDGKNLLNGTYFYLLKYDGNKKVTGYVVIQR